MHYGSLLPAEIRRDHVAQEDGRFGRWLRRLAAWMPH
jgi:hypothetical protein